MRLREIRYNLLKIFSKILSIIGELIGCAFLSGMQNVSVHSARHLLIRNFADKFNLSVL